MRDIGRIGKDKKPCGFELEAVLNFACHVGCLTDDAISAAVAERVSATREAVRVRAKSLSESSVLTNHDSRFAGDEGFEREDEQIEMSNAGEDEMGPKLPDQSE